MKKVIQSTEEKEKFFIENFIKEYFNYYYIPIRQKELNAICLYPSLMDKKNYINNRIIYYNNKIQLLDDFDNNIRQDLIFDFKDANTMDYESNIERVKSEWVSILCDNCDLLCHSLSFGDFPIDAKSKDWIRDEKIMRLEGILSENEIQDKLLRRSLKIFSEVFKLKQNDTKQYEFDGIWTFDFNRYKSYQNSNRKIEILIDHCDLFVYLVNIFTLNSYIENNCDKAEIEILEGKSVKEILEIEIKPIIKPEYINGVFEIIKDFFSIEHQSELKKILETGNNAKNPLIFLDNGNRLADVFKQLKKSDIITGCEQKELENWVCVNFNYRYRQKIKEYTPRYLNDIISTNKDKCQNPILNVTIEKLTGKVFITKV